MSVWCAVAYSGGEAILIGAEILAQRLSPEPAI